MNIKVINTKPDKFLIQCIEIDLYDLLYKNSVNKYNSLSNEVLNVMDRYKVKNDIKDYVIQDCDETRIVIDVFLPKKIRVKCIAP